MRCISFESYIKPQLSEGFLDSRKCCISFESYIKPQHLRHPLRTGGSCISFESYIKPQLYLNYFFFHVVVYLLNPTSNHNFALVGECPLTLYIFWILHQTTTQLNAKDLKNQLYIFWILHQTTTYTESSYYNSVLYIFWILHQTTTVQSDYEIGLSCISFESYIKPQLRIIWQQECLCCISFESYIKPQLWSDRAPAPNSCISFESYIKPQRAANCKMLRKVVYLLNPTSNHNSGSPKGIMMPVVYLLNPTSNHNVHPEGIPSARVVYLLNPTSNHNSGGHRGTAGMLYIFWILHQTTTYTYEDKDIDKLYIFWILHQTTTSPE